MYTTVTNGAGDLRAAAVHRKAVQRMFLAAMRRPCAKPECAQMCDCFDSTAMMVLVSR